MWNCVLTAAKDYDALKKNGSHPYVELVHTHLTPAVLNMHGL
jgi:hypothetical protein